MSASLDLTSAHVSTQHSQILYNPSYNHCELEAVEIQITETL